MKDTEIVDNLVVKQKELMAKVPHPLRKDAYQRASAVVDLIETELLYLNSTGHKPWRPDPLPESTQRKAVAHMKDSMLKLLANHNMIGASDDRVDTIGSRMLVSTFGAIEEAVEFYRSSGLDVDEENRPHMLEELTDELFFFLERMILANFTWDDVINEYHRKWDVNMKRYADAAKGDMSWDDRGKKEGL